MQLTTHKEEHKKRSRRGSSFFFDETFLSVSPFLIFYRTLHLETYALTRFFSKSASWCVFSLSHPSLLLLPLRVV
jgi:hypothetical protein